MTGKQFTFDNDSLLKDGEFWLDGSVATICNAEEIVELLNEFHEENEQLKQQLKTKHIVNKQYEELQRLKKENNELKEELRIYRQVANCHNCIYHDYDWFDDGDEFEVCRKGNDVSEGICKDWEEL